MRTLLILGAALLLSPQAFAGFCGEWSTPESIGSLPFPEIREASGMAASKNVADRLYWINDSGDKGQFFHTSRDGSGVTKVKIENFDPKDTEAMGYGECPEGTCLLIADIGDNRKKRGSIDVIFVLEQTQFPAKIKALRRVSLKYPDGARDAEALALLPNGDLVIISKELNPKQIKVNDAGVYTLSKQELAAPGSKPRTLRKLGTLPLPAWTSEDGLIGGVVTDMAVDSRRQVVGILTYSRVIEIPLARFADLSKTKEWKKDTDYALIPFHSLEQQETMAYAPESDRVFWSTEYSPPRAALFSMTCNRPLP